ncbi:MAG TPA: SAM-dependent methyltransferase [Pseudobdellovibrionaceae bacterium]|nr:SAM-dependent methyltransferase [Pseudobdellovibrionaceae bacterium]
MVYLIATPIGDTQEITLRALEILKQTQHILCESTKETSKLLRQHSLTNKTYHILNEHSTEADLLELTALCESQDVALVSDCGTPGFCDPGNDLIRMCRQKNIAIRSVLGPSSLMGILSLTSQRLPQFHFAGFPPAESDSRQQWFGKLKHQTNAIILMDTPYRLRKLVSELKEFFPQRRALLVCNLSQENEEQHEGLPADIEKSLRAEKAEFMALVYPTAPPHPKRLSG